MTSILLAIKFAEDFYYDNGYYAKVGGLAHRELNNLEVEMLQLLDFRLFIDDAVYEKYRVDVLEFVRHRVGIGGGEIKKDGADSK